MATSADLLQDAFDRVAERVRSVLDGVDPALVGRRIDPQANPLNWLVWHLTRVQDDHVAAALGREERWATWRPRLDPDSLPALEGIGYGHTSEEVGHVAALLTTTGLLLGYFEAVHAATLEALGGIDEADLDRVVDRRWDPPVTLATRLVSVIDDCMAHAGQAAYLRGHLESVG